MKVIALNASPRGEGQSKTRMMLDSLVQGMRDGGAEVEVVHLRDKKVNHCIGCYTCWTKTPGVCVHKDDMTLELLPRWIQADLAVYATPLYHYTVTASLKAFIERTLPMVEPFILERNGRSSHPLRGRLPKAVVLSVAGFPEMSVFDQLSAYVRFLFREGLLAEVYRPGAEVMGNPAYRDFREAVLEAVRKAGEELVRDRRISSKTMDRITQPLGSSEEFVKVANLFWKTCIAKGLTPKEFQEKNLVPRPDSLEAFMLILPMGFRPEAAPGLAATFQFDFTDSVTGSCHFTIESGRIQAKNGPAAKADLVIQSPFETWMDIMTGKADGQEMFLAGKYRVIGDLSLLIRMGALFRG
jgi:multimeric flavodoxin WrbA